MIEHLSAAFTLEVGMLITTGTPAGVAAGEDPPLGCRPGTRSLCEVGGWRRLTNPVVDEPVHGGDRSWVVTRAGPTG